MKKRINEMYRLGEIRAIYAHEDRLVGLRATIDLNGSTSKLQKAYLQGFAHGRTLRHVD